MKANSPVERLYNGIVKENPTFVMMIGMCPTLGTTSSAINGMGNHLGFQWCRKGSDHHCDFSGF